MKYNVFLPLSALVALTIVTVLVNLEIIPPGQALLDGLKDRLDASFYIIIFVIILLESILYVGFYFPGQFFAVILVVGANPSISSIVYLTLAMVAAATLGSFFNFQLGKRVGDKDKEQNETKLKHLLIAMIHINSLAFFMFSQGAANKNAKVVWLAGVLNLPYYLLLIIGTAVLSEHVMAMAENAYVLFTAISIWLIIAAVLDYRAYVTKETAQI
ncbi:hypothetical protein [Agaribacter marinus]|uniref:Membrane-associated protein n=1 Tax=Agaribacter marinus TaxID=1431249 RepID=A0AA37SVY3_9ALTE|nr:hypothetical protein [Agaribacter marinus]GLR70437.1 hypothetical protein GCM10007852_13450 [Agaribacter marinus]